MKIYVGGIVYRELTVEYHDSMLRLQSACSQRGIALENGVVKGDALISRSRSLAASAFLRSTADVLLTIDSDVWFLPDDAIALCQKAIEYNLIGALYMTRALATQPAMMLPSKQVIFAANSPPVEVPFISTGFMAVHRRGFEDLAPTLPHCHQTFKHNGTDTSFWPFYMPFCIEWPEDGYLYLSEDWALCQRAKDAGYKVHLDPSIRLGHMGTKMFTLEDLLVPPKPKPVPLVLHRAPGGELQTAAVPDSFYVPTPKLDVKIAQGEDNVPNLR